MLVAKANNLRHAAEVFVEKTHVALRVDVFVDKIEEALVTVVEPLSVVLI